MTAWHYCYYTDYVDEFEANYTAHFAVWEYDISYLNLTIVKNTLTFVVLEPISTITNIHCKQVTLEPKEIFFIKKGELLGVVLPPKNPIPLIGHSSNHTIISFSNNHLTPSSIPLTNLSTEKLAMHLYVNIGK